jgi:malate dehydrogenase (oxaloacetate-decarboxylating)
VVATGRSDFPNQVNNSLCFPGIFRGVLDVRATTITDTMCFAAAEALAAAAGPPRADRILPSMDEWRVFPAIAAAAGLQAQTEGVARVSASREKLLERAEALIRRSQSLTALMMEKGFIPPDPEEDKDA